MAKNFSKIKYVTRMKLKKKQSKFNASYSFETKPTFGIPLINKNNPLKVIKTLVQTTPITSMKCSPNGLYLATTCLSGSCQVWDLETFDLISLISEKNDTFIDEYYCCDWSSDSKMIVFGGKRKDRTRWSEYDDDNHILACPIKIWNLEKNEITTELHGHQEEILSVQFIYFESILYVVSTSQDGFICKWELDHDYQLVEWEKISLPEMCMVFTLCFLPGTSNRYFIASCDDSLRIFDFKTCALFQTFPGLNTCYCDCVKVVTCIELDQPNEQDWFCYLLSRGVEVLDAENNTINTIPNSVLLHKLIFPTESESLFQLEKIQTFQNPEYRSNSWLVKINSNGKYVACPTYDGNVYFFDLKTGQVSAILRDHDEIEVRDCLFHPYRDLFFTCADDGKVLVYSRDVNIEP